MSGHQGGVTSKLSRDLSNIQCQLRSGKTIKGKDLTPETKEKLEQKKAAILEMMTAEKEARHDERMKAINDHTTEVVNKAAEKIETKLNEKFAPLDALFGGAASGDLNEQITAARNEVKFKQAWIASKLNEKKRDSAQKKADAKAAREEKKKAKSKRKGKDTSPVEEVASTAEPDEEEKIESSDEDLPQTPSTEMPEEDANVEDCATLQEAREYYDFVNECAARCDEYAKFMLGDLKRDTEKGAIEELACKLKRERLAWFSPKCNMFGGKQLQKLVEKIVTKITYGSPEMTKNVAAALNYDLSDTGSQHRVKYLKDFFVMSGEDRIMAVVACLQ